MSLTKYLQEIIWSRSELSDETFQIYKGRVHLCKTETCLILKANKIRLKYPKNSVSRRKFGFEMSRKVNTSAIRSTAASKRYISSSSLTDRNKNFKMMNPNTKHQLYKRKIPVFKDANPRVNSIKPLNKSLKHRSMSKSQLAGKENLKASLRYIRNLCLESTLRWLRRRSTIFTKIVDMRLRIPIFRTYTTCRQTLCCRTVARRLERRTPSCPTGPTTSRTRS